MGTASLPKAITAITVIVTIAASTGCASMPKMNASAPIEKRSAFLGTSYEQDGKAIDRQDMLSKLEQEPAAAEELSGHGALSTSSFLLALAGGALVGWPIGQAIGGEDDPLWVLAGVGGGLIAVSIPLAIVADNKVDNAVDAHNRTLGAGAQSAQPWDLPKVRVGSVQMCTTEPVPGMTLDPL